RFSPGYYDMSMTRYLLIEFDEDAQADQLKRKIDVAEEGGKGFRVVGLYARPRSVCQCARPRDTKLKDLVKRGPKFGWWTCTTCRRPRMGDHQLLNLLRGQGMRSSKPTVAYDPLSPGMQQQKWNWVPDSLTLTLLPRSSAIRLGKIKA